MTGPVFTMLGDSDAVACTGDSCGVPASGATRATADRGARQRPVEGVHGARVQEAPAASPAPAPLQEAPAPSSAPAP